MFSLLNIVFAAPAENTDPTTVIPEDEPEDATLTTESPVGDNAGTTPASLLHRISARKMAQLLEEEKCSSRVLKKGNK